MRFREGRTFSRPGIGKEIQRPGFGDLGIKLAQAAGGCVARIGKSLAARLVFARIESRKVGMAHIDFAADLDEIGPILASQFRRDVIQCQRVRGDVFADQPVSACCSTFQFALFIGQAERQTVNFRLGGEFQCLGLVQSEEAPDAPGKLGDVFV